MTVSKSKTTSVAAYIDLKFLLRFFILMIGLYYFNFFYIGLIDPKGRVYSAFLDNYLDYITGLRNAILFVSNGIVHCFGISSYISDYRTLSVAGGGPSVYIAYTCLGYGVISFWLAFVLAQSDGWKKKLTWSIAGLVAIWLINCLRVGLLLVAYTKHWQVNKYINHHDLFNIVVYLAIIAMVYRYYRSTSTANPQSLSATQNSIAVQG